MNLFWINFFFFLKIPKDEDKSLRLQFLICQLQLFCQNPNFSGMPNDKYVNSQNSEARLTDISNHTVHDIISFVI